MSTSFRRKAAAITFAVLGLSLAGGGIAVAQPTAKAPDAVQPAARSTNAQPPVTAESARSAKAALKSGATTLAARTTIVVVNANGTRARGVGTVIKYGVGQYEVQFAYTVTNAVFVATIGRADACCVPPPGEISVSARLGTPNGVFVQTRNSAGTPADLGFHLVVHTS
ncbi:MULTISPECIES: hypothetical protein [unclassified Micromonospora]|uniref:hypothetical protein n=1 Tax=unclassified Micromonospora TaxID=2617518 RepID=UPI000EF4A666|nr:MULTISPECIES: hypothetical protein [unclassified Micromonospora]RLP92296.1 hypothetical protein EAD89_09010 [Micromonospora sp. BL4]RLP95803.1 hypothetical protein EAD98_12545 [Micromonospora sp. CV4]